MEAKSKEELAIEIFDKECYVEHPIPFNEKVYVYYPNAIDAMKIYSSQQNSQLIQEVKELKEEIEGTGKEILKQQFEIIEGGLRTEVVRVNWIKMMFTKLGVDIEQKIDF